MIWSEIIHSTLETVGVPVSRYISDKKLNRYIVWQEDDFDYFRADNRPQIRTVRGTIDLFTKTYDDEAVYAVEKALTDSDISFGYNSFQFEEDTRYLHHEWTFEILDLR